MSNGNENIVHIEAIEGLASEMNAHIELIQVHNPLQQQSKEQALRDVNDFQAGTLHDMRILFEGE